MAATILADEELEHDPDGALRATSGGPVMIAEEGVVTYVLLSYDEYLKLQAE